MCVVMLGYDTVMILIYFIIILLVNAPERMVLGVLRSVVLSVLGCEVSSYV